MGLPDAPIHDLAIQPREHELIIGTHGRSIYIANVSQLKKLNSTILSKNIHLFNTEKIHFSSGWGKTNASWDTASTPSTMFCIYAKNDLTAKLGAK